jgi:hypothetical protein
MAMDPCHDHVLMEFRFMCRTVAASTRHIIPTMLPNQRRRCSRILAQTDQALPSHCLVCACKKKVLTGECPSTANNATMLSILHPPNSFTSCHQQPQPPHTGRRVVARVVWLYTRTNMASRARRVGRTQDEDVSVVADLEKALQPRRHLAKHMSTSMHMHFHLCTYVQPEMSSQAQSVIGAQQGLHPHRSQHHPSGPTSFPTPTPTARGPSPIAVR